MASGTAGDDKLIIIGNSHGYVWNRKLCFQAQELLFSCVDAQPNGNKFRCPDELYAYEMHCPGDFRRVASTNRRMDERDKETFDPKYIEELNYKKQNMKMGHFEY